MKFSRVIGKIDGKLVQQAEEKLSQIFLELGTKYSNDHVGSGMGGDPMIFTLVYPVEHVCTLNMPTAATDGKRYYWNPKFVIKQSRIGLRIICAHEAWHAIYMHPQRRGSRMPRLWNIAVDYIVNGCVMDDFKARKMNPTDMFNKHLGKFMTLTQYAEMIKNPYANVKGMEGFNPDAVDTADPTVKLPKPDEDRELTDKEIKELEKREKLDKFYFADPDLSDEMKRPEAIYDFLYKLLPKCAKCGSVGVYKKKDKKDKSGKDKDKKDQNGGKDKKQAKGKDKGKDKGDGQGQDQNHEHGDGQQCDCPGHEQGEGEGQGDQQGQGCGHGCDECGGGIDVFGLGGTVDDHMDSEESPEKMAKKLSDAIETARKMAGHVPGALEDELGKLTAPQVTWQDIIRTKLLKVRAGNGRNDWTRFKSRPLFTGLLVPKRRDYFANFGVLLDTSGSMSKDDMAYGISQLQNLDDRGECTIVFADSEIYWDAAVKVKRCNAEILSTLKPVGRGGTIWAPFFAEYEKQIGKCDFLVIITDGYLMDTDVAEMRDPGIPVYWLITSGASFKAPFGKVMELRSM